jgi:hypothetical protein
MTAKAPGQSISHDQARCAIININDLLRRLRQPKG